MKDWTDRRENETKGKEEGGEKTGREGQELEYITKHLRTSLGSMKHK